MNYHLNRLAAIHNQLEPFADIFEGQPVGNHIIHDYGSGFDKADGFDNVRRSAIIGGEDSNFPGPKFINRYGNRFVGSGHGKKDNGTALVNAPLGLLNSSQSGSTQNDGISRLAGFIQ